MPKLKYRCSLMHPGQQCSLLPSYCVHLLHMALQLAGVLCCQGLMVLLQSLPTDDWTDEEVGLVLADAYRLKFMFADAPKHLGDATP